MPHRIDALAADEAALSLRLAPGGDALLVVGPGSLRILVRGDQRLVVFVGYIGVVVDRSGLGPALLVGLSLLLQLLRVDLVSLHQLDLLGAPLGVLLRLLIGGGGLVLARIVLLDEALRVG